MQDKQKKCKTIIFFKINKNIKNQKNKETIKKY